MSLKGDFYTTASPEDFWIEVINSPIYRSSQSRNNPKFLSRQLSWTHINYLGANFLNTFSSF